MGRLDFDVRTLRTEGELRAIAPEWDALFARAGANLPFLLPDWMTVWWRHFRSEDRAVRDSLRVVVARRRGELVAVLPMMLTERVGPGPLRVRTLNFLGADPYITELRTPLVDPKHEVDVAPAIVRHLIESGGWDWIAWSGFVQGSPFVAAIERAISVQWEWDDENEAWHPGLVGNVLRLAPTWDAFRGGLKRNIKESLRHCYNSLKRDGHEIRFDVAERPDDVARALGDFFRLHAMRAGLTDTVEHPDRFGAPRPRAFLEEVCAVLAEKRITRVFTLRVKDDVVASRVGFALPGCLYLYYSGFDPAWRKYSVMTTAVAEILKYAIASGFPTAHLSTGTDTSKSRWGPEETVFHRAYTVNPRPLSRAAYEAYCFAGRMRRDPRVRQALDRLLPMRTAE